MDALHFPWLLLLATAPLAGSAWVRHCRNPEAARRGSLIAASIVLALAGGAWADFRISAAPRAADPLDPLFQLTHKPVLWIDELSSMLLPYSALLFGLVLLAAPRVKRKQFSAARTLVAESIVLATFSCRATWLVALLLVLGMIPVWQELRERTQFGSAPALRVFSLYLGTSALLLGVGCAVAPVAGAWAAVLLLSAVLVRQALVPFHAWMPELFEATTFGTALLFVSPLVSAHGAIVFAELLAPQWALQILGIAATVTALYSSGMALVQRDARRFFCYLFMSHSALVFVGLGSTSPVARTGGLCLWLSSGLALSGFGLTIWSLEARRGRLSLATLHGGYEHAPLLAACYLLTGLASVGFPGTLGFVGAELMVDGAVETTPLIGIGVVVAASLNGIAVVKSYFSLFTGRMHRSTISLRMQARERLAVLVLAALLLGGGLFPHSLIASRYAAATSVLRPPSSDPGAHRPPRGVRHTALRLRGAVHL